jgi:hypothetical protein
MMNDVYTNACQENCIWGLVVDMWFFVKFINNEKIEESDEIDNDAYTLHVKRLAITDL